VSAGTVIGGGGIGNGNLGTAIDAGRNVLSTMAIKLPRMWSTAAIDFYAQGNPMRSKALALQSFLEMTENRAKACQFPGHKRIHRRSIQLAKRKPIPWFRMGSN
jgi:hypothetical protein